MRRAIKRKTLYVIMRDIEGGGAARLHVSNKGMLRAGQQFILDAPLVLRAPAYDLRRTTPRPTRNTAPMTDIITKPNTKDEIKVERPHLHKVILGPVGEQVIYE